MRWDLIAPISEGQMPGTLLEGFPISIKNCQKLTLHRKRLFFFNLRTLWTRRNLFPSMDILNFRL